MRQGRVGRAAGEIARQPADLAATLRNVSIERRRPARARPAASRPRSTAHTAPPDPPARPPADREPFRVGAQRRMRRQPRLPDPGLARHKHRLSRAPARLRAGALQKPPLGHPADIRDPRHRPQRRRQGPRADVDPGLVRQRLPNDREGLHRLRNPLQLQLPDRLKPRAVNPARQQLRRRRDEDPVRWRLVAQPGRLGCRHPEVLPILDQRLASPQPDPHPQPLLGPPISPLKHLLGQHRTTDRRRRRSERDHQPVARVLELPAPGRVDRLPQQPEELLAHLIPPHRADRRR